MLAEREENSLREQRGPSEFLTARLKPSDSEFAHNHGFDRFIGHARKAFIGSLSRIPQSLKAAPTFGMPLASSLKLKLTQFGT
jgi:hypothetical protein